MRTTTILTAVLSIGLLGCGSVSSDDGADAFVDNRPLVSSVTPDRGPAGGGIALTVSGTGFDNGEAFVVVGGRAATDVTVVDDTQITLTLPPGEQEARVTLTVFNDGGVANLLQAFTYNPAPAAVGVSPDLGPASGGTTITITGSGFADGPATVLVDGEPATSVVIVNDTTITAVTPALGDRPAYVGMDVVVENPAGVAMVPAAFRYKRPGLLMGRQSNYRSELEMPEDRTLIYYLDPIARVAVPLFQVRWGIKALDVHSDGTLYAVSNRRNTNNQRTLLRIDPLAGEVTPIGPLVMAGTTTECRVLDIAFNGSTLYGLRNYYVTDVGSRLSLTTISLTTGACTDVSATQHTFGSYATSIGLALKDANTFYVVSRQDIGPVYQLTTTNQLVGTPVNLSDTLFQRCAGLAYVSGTLYSLGRYDSGLNGRLMTINPVDGSTTVFMEEGIPYYAKGLCRTPPSMN